MTLRAEPVTDARFDQAESPRWDARGDRLLWVDLRRSTLYTAAFDGACLQEIASYAFDGKIGCAAPIASLDAWVVASGRALFVQRESGERTQLASGIGEPGEYFNDGAADPSGRFWVGTQCVPREPVCHLYSLERDGSVIERLDGVTVSNGLAFTPNGRTLYYIDTLPHRSIEAFDVAPDGSLSGRRTVAKIDGGNPDGMAADLEGNLWVAVWDAGEVRHYSPEGRLLRSVRLPASRPTAVTLHRDTLVITTARAGLAHPGELDGAIFALQVSIGGSPAAPWAADIPGTQV